MVGSFVRAVTPLEWPLSDKNDFFTRPLLYEVDVFVALPCDGCMPILSYSSNCFPTHGFNKK